MDIPLAPLNQVQRGGVRLAGARPARGAGDRADPVAAQAAADATSCRRRTSPGRCCPGSDPAPRGPARRAGHASCAGSAACTCPGRAFDWSRLPRAPADHLPGDRRRPRCSPQGKDLDELQPPAAAPAAGHAAAEAAPRMTRTGLRDLGHRHAAAGVQPRRGPARTRRWPTRATRSTSGCSRRAAPGGCGACCAAPAGCSCSQVPSGARAVASRLPTSAKLALSRNPYRSAARCSTTARPPPRTRSSPRPAARPGTQRASPGCCDVGPGRTGRPHRGRGRARRPGARRGAPGRGQRWPRPRQPRGARRRSPTCGPSSARLVYPGFVAETGARRLPDLVRYLRGDEPPAGQAAGRRWAGTPSGWPWCTRVQRGLRAGPGRRCRRRRRDDRTSAACAG